MSVDWNSVAEAWHADQPHPDNPDLTVGEFATAVKLATRSRFGGHASAHEAGAFWHEFQTMNEKLLAQGKDAISPEEYGNLLDKLAPHSYAYQGRPPTLDEIVRHRDAENSTAQKYYADLPDKHYPHVRAGDMAKFLGIAEPFAMQNLGRRPTKLEAAQFALSGLNASGIGDYYRAASEYRPGAVPIPAGMEVGSELGPLERRIRDAPPPLSGDRRSPSPRPTPPESGGPQEGVTE